MPPLPDDFGMLEEKYERDIEPIEIPNLISFDKPPSIQERPLGSFENPLFTQIGIGLTGTPLEERSKRLLKPIEIPRRDEISIDRLPALPRPDMMPISLPEPMPIQPRMPMPLPIASPLPSTPMPMAPINLPRLELPQTNRIDRQIPMMPRMGVRGRR